MPRPDPPPATAGGRHGTIWWSSWFDYFVVGPQARWLKIVHGGLSVEFAGHRYWIAPIAPGFAAIPPGMGVHARLHRLSLGFQEILGFGRGEKIRVLNDGRGHENQE